MDGCCSTIDLFSPPTMEYRLLSPPESQDLLSGLAIGRTNIVNKPFVVHPSVS